MSMYKNIFVTEETGAAGEQTISINGEVNLYGEGAYSSLEQAVSAVAKNVSNAVIKVQSGKYESFYVVNDNVLSAPVQVIAVNFNGGEMAQGDNTVTIPAANFSEAEQLEIIDGLNAISAANGVVYVAEAENATRTLYVTNGADAYSVGSNTGAAVYGENANGIVNTVTQATPFIYVDKAYNASTEGFGVTRFQTYDAAFNYAKDNAPAATLVIEGATANTPGNSLIGEKTGHRAYPQMDIIVKNGASLGVSNHSQKLTHDLTLEAGAGFYTMGAGGDPSRIGNVQVEADLTVGEAGEGKAVAKVDMINGNQHDMNVVVKGTGTLTANNAEFTLADFSTIGNAEVNDSTLNVAGTAAIGRDYEEYSDSKQVFTNTTMNVTGTTSVDGDAAFDGTTSYYTAENHLADLTMDNSQFTYNDGKAESTVANLTIHDVDMSNKSAITTEGIAIVEGNLNMNDSALDAGMLLLDKTGTINAVDGSINGEIYNAGKISVNGGEISGKVYNTITNDAGETFTGSMSVSGETTMNGEFYGKAVKIAEGSVLTSTEGVVFEKGNSVTNVTFDEGDFAFGEYLYAYKNLTVEEGADVTVGSASTGGTFGMWDNSSVSIAQGASLAASSIYFNGGSITVDGTLTAISGYDGGLILNGAGDTITVNEDAVLNAGYVGIYKSSGDSTVDLKGTANIGGKMSDGDGKFTWNVEGGSLSAKEIAMNNAESSISINDGSVVTGKLINKGRIEVKDSTLAVSGDAESLGSADGIWVSGESTLQIGNLNGRVYVEDGAVLNDSYAKSTKGGTTRFLGSVTLNGGYTADYFYGVSKDDASGINGVGGTITIEGTVYATKGVEITNDYTLQGGKIVVADAEGDGVWGFVLQSATIEVSTDVEIDGAGGKYAPIQMSYADITINSSITQKNSGGEVIYITGSTVTLTETGSLNGSISIADATKYGYEAVLNVNGGMINSNTIYVKTGTELYVNDGSVKANKIEAAADATIAVTVSAEKLSAIQGVYNIIEQTDAKASVLNSSITVDGKSYAIGDSLMFDGIKYTVTNGDGNDIAIEAAATVLTVDASYTEETVGYGFNKFSSFASAMQQAAAGNVDEIIINSDITEAMPTDVFFVVDNDIKITAAKEVDIRLTNEGTMYDIVMGSNNGSKIIVDKNVSLKLDNRVIWVGHHGYAQGADIEINGLVDGNQWWNGGDTTVNAGGKLISSGEALVMRNGSTLKVIGDAAQGAAAADRTTQLDANYFSFLSGNLLAYNTKIESGPLWVNNTGGYAAEGAALIEVDNTVWEASSNFKLNSDATAQFNVLNGSTVSFTGSEHGASEIGANGSLNVSDSTFTAGAVNNTGAMTITDSVLELGELVNKGTVNVGGESTLKIDKASGSAIKVNDGTTLLDGTSVNGVHLVTMGTLTIDGDVSIAKGNYLYNYYGKDDSGTTVYQPGTLTITEGSTLTGGNLQYYAADIQGEGKIEVDNIMLYDNTVSVDVDARVNVYFYDGSVIDGATLTQELSAGDKCVWVRGSTTFQNGAKFVLKQDSIRLDNAGVAFTANASEVDGVSMSLLYADNVFALENGAKATFSGEIGNAGTITVNDSVFSADKIDGKGTVVVTGDSTIHFNTLKSSATVAFGDLAGDRSTLNIGSVSGEGAAATAGRLNLYNADVTLNDNVSVTTTGTLSKINNAVVDMNGNTLTYTGFTVLDSGDGVDADGVTLKNGEFKVNTNHLCFQGYNHVISADATVTVDGSMHNSSMVNVYGTTTIYGTVNVTHGNYGYDNVGTLDTGWAYLEKSELTVSGKDASYSIENGHMFRVIHAGETTVAGVMNVVDGASFSFTGSRQDTGLFFNSNIVNVDAASRFTVDSYYGYNEGGTVKGAFNSDVAGEMVVLGEVNVNNNLVTDSLIVNQGAVLSAGAINVENLTLNFGGTLALGDGASKVAADYITVVGEMNPKSAEFHLVSSGFAGDLLGKQVWFDVNGDNVIADSEKFTIQTNVTGLTGLNFVSVDGNLYVKDFGAATTGIYIGDDVVGNAGDKITAADGATYTIGVDAFATVEDAAAVVDAAAITSINLGSGDHVTDVADKFANVTVVNVQPNAVIEDSAAAIFNTDLVINNDGHLDADITAADEMKIVNTSVNTLLGSYSTDIEITVDNEGGMIGDASAAATTFNTGYLTVNGGDAVNVEVNADQLELSDTNSFGLNADSSILSGSIWGSAGSIFLNGSANMSIDGDVETDVLINSEAAHTGTVTLNGDQTFNGFVGAANIAIADGKEVTLKDADFANLNIGTDATLNVDLDSMNSFTMAGAVTGDGTLNSTAAAPWIMNDSVYRDFSGFEGTFTMEDANGEVVMGKGDALASLNVADSYFADGTDVVVNGDQAATLAGNGMATGIEFSGNGSLNIGDYDGGFADGSDGFTQTLTGNNAGFTGTVNVSEGAELTIENALGASAIQLDYNANTGVTGDADDTKLILNKEGLELGSVITGDANDMIDVKENATLTANNSVFKGIVDVTEGKALTLKGNMGAAEINLGTEDPAVATTLNVDTTSNMITIDSAITGDVNDVINFSGTKDVSFYGDNSNFNGTLNINLNKAGVWAKVYDDFGGAGSVVNFVDKGLFYAFADITVGSVFKSTDTTTSIQIFPGKELTLSADGALNDFVGVVNMTRDTTLNLNGDNDTDAVFQVNNFEVSTLNLGGDLTLNTAGAIDALYGIVNINDNTLTINGTTGSVAKFTGSSDADIVINANTTLKGAPNPYDQMTGIDALTGFNGTVTIADDKVLTLDSTNTTAAKVVSTNGTLVLDAKNAATVNEFTTAGALNGMNGTVTVKDSDATLKLSAENTTAATLTGKGVVDADADQVFSGDVTGFTGNFDIAADKEVQLTGTFADADNKVVNAFGGTLTLADKDVEVQVNAGTSTLNTVNFGNNSLTVGTGDFVNINGTGSVVFADAHTDNAFASLVAGDVTLTGGRDITATEFDGDLNITISVADNDIADVITNSTYSDVISVTITDSALLTGNDYNVIKAGAFTITSIELTAGGETKTLKLNDSVKLDGYTYSLREKEGVWVIDQRTGYSNFVVINASWTAEPYAYVNDNGVDRAIGFDAAGNLDKAAEYIRGWNVGQGWDNGNLQMGDAKIELVSGKFSQTAGNYMMTAENLVTQLTVSERDGETAIINGVFRGSDGSKATTLTIEGVRIQATELYAGGNLVIANTAADKSAGNVIAAGIGNTTANSDVTMANASSLTLNGGYFSNRILVGGSVSNAEGATVTVDGETSVMIDNNSGEAMTITSNIYGGSWAAVGTVVQNSDANITINVDEEINLRGNIYVSGGASAQGSLTMNGNSTITFTGDASKLTFSGSVNAIQSDKNEIAVFENFDGAFNGSLVGFDSITISGSTALELGRRQTGTADTDVNFVVTADTNSADAMYTVRDANRWEFSNTISVDSTAVTSGSYILVDNFAGDFSSMNLIVNGTASVLGDIVDGAMVSVNADNQLVLDIFKTDKVVVDSSNTDVVLSGNIMDVTTTNNSKAVQVTTADATVSNEGTLIAAATQGSVAIHTNKANTTVNNAGTITAADAEKYNRAIHGEGGNLNVANDGVINGEIYNNYYGAKELNVENNGTITAFTTAMGGNSVISASNGLTTLSGDNGTYELAVNPETGRFNGEIVEGQHGILVTASNTTFKAGNDITVGTGSVAGLVNDSGKNIVISGDNNTIAIAARRSSYGIEEYSYSDSSANPGSDVIISGNNTTISVASTNDAIGIFDRNGDIIITGSGTEITATSAGSYAIGLNTNDVMNYSGNIIVGEFNSDGSVATASDLKVSVSGQTTFSGYNAERHNIAVFAQKGTAQIALSADGVISSNNAAVRAESVQISNAGTIIGDVIATGSAVDDTISMDIDALLNGNISGVEVLNITGVSSLTTDIAGAKALTGEVDNILTSATIDGVAVDFNGTKTQIAGTATAETADDIWASLDKGADGSLTVAWGRNEAEVGAALDAFKADSTLTIGDSLVADATSLADGAEAADFSEKKNNGTLA